MSKKVVSFSSRQSLSLGGYAAVLFVCTLLSTAWGQQAYLPKGRPDSVALLPPPPALGSAEQAADLASARAVFKHRTAEETARAKKDASLSLFNFSSAIGPSFQAGKFPKTEALFERVKKEISPVIDTPKNHWKRSRPYEIDRKLTLGEPEPSRSYPSGHSIRGTLQALMLAELFPERKEPILEMGRNIGWDRVLIGKHFPTDIYAGRVVAYAIFHELMASPAFVHDLSEAKAEVHSDGIVKAQSKELTTH